MLAFQYFADKVNLRFFNCELCNLGMGRGRALPLGIFCWGCAARFLKLLLNFRPKFFGCVFSNPVTFLRSFNVVLYDFSQEDCVGYFGCFRVLPLFHIL